MPTKKLELYFDKNDYEKIKYDVDRFISNYSEEMIQTVGISNNQPVNPMTAYVTLEKALSIYMYLRPIDDKDLDTFQDPSFKEGLEFDLLGVRIKDKEDIIHFVAKNLIETQYGEIDDMDDLETVDKHLKDRGLIGRTNDAYATFC